MIPGAREIAMPPTAVMLVSFSACVARLSAALGLQTGVGRCPLAINQLRIWACRPLSAPAPGVGGVVDSQQLAEGSQVNSLDTGLGGPVACGISGTV